MQFFQASWVNRWNLCGSPLSTKNVSSCCTEVSQSESPDHKVHQEQPSAPQHQISECLTQQVLCRFPLCSRLVLSLFYLCSRIFTNTFTNLLILAHLANSLSNRRVVVRQAWPKLEICQQALTSRRFKLGSISSMVKNMAKTKPSKRSVEYTQSTHILYIHICLHNMFICLLLPWFDITLIAWCYLCLKQLQSMYVSMAIKWTPNCLHMDVTGNSGHATRAGAAVVKRQFGNQACLISRSSLVFGFKQCVHQCAQHGPK